MAAMAQPGGGGERGEISPPYMIPWGPFSIPKLLSIATCEQHCMKINIPIGRLGKAVPGLKGPIS